MRSDHDAARPRSGTRVLLRRGDTNAMEPAYARSDALDDGDLRAALTGHWRGAIVTPVGAAEDERGARVRCWTVTP